MFDEVYLLAYFLLRLLLTRNLFNKDLVSMNT